MFNFKKSLGQNLLKDNNIRKKIVSLCSITNNIIIEIGPGLGFLTDNILEKKPKKLILIEKDKKFYNNLINKYSHQKNIEIYNNDALLVNYNKFNDVNIISNLPYNISTKLIFKLLKFNKNINCLVLMIQKEVALKFDYNRKKMNKYKFLISLLSDYKICFNVHPNSFYPKPKVYSSVIKVILNKKSHDWNKIDSFIRVLFKSRRKIISNLIKLKNLNNINIHKKRVEELNISEILKLYQMF